MTFQLTVRDKPAASATASISARLITGSDAIGEFVSTIDVPIYAWDRSPDVQARILKAYPDRNVWILVGPSLTGNGYQVVAWPQLSAQRYCKSAKATRPPNRPLRIREIARKKDDLKTPQQKEVDPRGTDESTPDNGQRAKKTVKYPAYGFDITRDGQL